jgi:hypothetical protein
MNQGFRTITTLAAVSLALFVPSTAQAWLRASYEDATIVERSELIVVARLKAGKISYVSHQQAPDEGASWEHHATLVITEVLKGDCKEGEIPVIIHYGLDPGVDGATRREDIVIKPLQEKEGDPHNAVAIRDTGNSAMSLTPLIKDAREKNLWFLRKRSGTYGREPGGEHFGIVDPEDLQPFSLKDYFRAYLAKDPAAAVRKRVQGNPEETKRAQPWFDHAEIQQIMKLEDRRERCAKLLPHFLAGASEARNGLLTCGDEAGKQLTAIFDDPEQRPLRTEIINIWRDLNYRDAVPILVELLKKHDRFWAAQELEPGWWNNDVGSARTAERRDIYGEVYSAVCALKNSKDSRAIETLLLTRKRWQAINFDNKQIVEACEAALLD